MNDPKPEPKNALCQRHRDVVATHSCQRCGDFICEDCRGARGRAMCLSCEAFIEPETVEAHKLSVWASILWGTLPTTVVLTAGVLFIQGGDVSKGVIEFVLMNVLIMSLVSGIFAWVLNPVSGGALELVAGTGLCLFVGGGFSALSSFAYQLLKVGFGWSPLFALTHGLSVTLGLLLLFQVNHIYNAYYHRFYSK